MKESREFDTDCTGRACSYSIYQGEANCMNGNGSCMSAEFIEAAETSFHPRELKAATQQIKAILDTLQDSKGRKLSIINTHMGLLLVWVNHGVEIPLDDPEVVRDTDDAARIAEALKLEKAEYGKSAG